MRLALAGPFPPWRGGIAQFSLRLETALSAICETRRVTYSYLYPPILFPGTSQLDPGATGSREDHKAADAFLHSCNPLAWPGSARRIAAMSPDFTVAQYWHPFFAPALMHGLPRSVRRAAVCHNVMPHESFPLAGSLARRFLRSCGLLVVHSASDEEEAVRIAPGSRILRLFHPIYDQYVGPERSVKEARAELGLDPDRRTVLFFGLIRPYKGLDDLLEAVAMLPDGIDLLVAGECYSGRERLLERLGREDLSGRVRWIEGFIPDSRVDAVFRSADAVALPYRSATQSGVAQIALSFRKPLVLTRTGGLPELVEEGRTGFLAEPCDPAGLASAVEKALSLAGDASSRTAIAGLARRFSWETYASSLLEALG